MISSCGLLSGHRWFIARNEMES